MTQTPIHLIRQPNEAGVPDRGEAATVRPGEAAVFPGNDQHRLHGAEPAPTVWALEETSRGYL